MIDAPALQTILSSGISGFTRVDTFTVGATYTFTTETSVVKKGAYSSKLGLAPDSLDFTVSVGGAGAALSAFKAAALAGTLDGAAVTWTVTINGASALKFTGLVQRSDVSSTEVRIVAITELVKLDVVQLPSHVILSGEFPEVPPPANHNVR